MVQQAFCLDFPKKSRFTLLDQKGSTVPKMWSTGPKVNHRPQIGHLAHTHSGKKKRESKSLLKSEGPPIKEIPRSSKKWTAFGPSRPSTCPPCIDRTQTKKHSHRNMRLHTPKLDYEIRPLPHSQGPVVLQQILE